jgi:uncharacterized membrane protein
MAFCGNCGAPLSSGTGFCGSCGKQAASSTSNPATASAAQPVAAGNGGWAPVNAQPAVSVQVPQAQAPQPVVAPATPLPANQPPQNAGWSAVPTQMPASAPNSAAGWSSPPVQTAAAATAVAAAAGPGLTRNMAAALAYSLGIITGVLFLVLEPYRRDRFVRFHAMQSILYFVFAVVFNIAWSIVVGILLNISGWVALASVPLRLMISLAMFGLWLYLMYQAYSEREFRIPILGAIANQQAG